MPVGLSIKWRRAFPLIALCFFLAHQSLQTKATVDHSSRGLRSDMSFQGMSLVEGEGTKTTSRLDKTLVIYIYHESSLDYAKNLEFFIKVAIGKDANPMVDYVIVVNGEIKYLDLSGLPSNVMVIYRDNTCYDGGTVGTVLDMHVKLWLYKYYILVNSSVRGPFLPRFYPPSLPWTAALTELITDQVKLVGTTISCQGQVHVQSMVLATDYLGLRVLYDAGALQCAGSIVEAIHSYEYGSTTAMFKRGYTIDCLMSRYQGVDWRKNPRVDCNVGLNPQLDMMNDGLNVDPFEVLFVKTKEFPVVGSRHMINRYTDYVFGIDNITDSQYYSPRVQSQLRAEKAALLDRVKRCKASFDQEYYLRKNPDLVGVGRGDLYSHFEREGFLERRDYRFVADAHLLNSDPQTCKALAQVALG